MPLSVVAFSNLILAHHITVICLFQLIDNKHFILTLKYTFFYLGNRNRCSSWCSQRSCSLLAVHSALPPPSTPPPGSAAARAGAAAPLRSRRRWVPLSWAHTSRQCARAWRRSSSAHTSSRSWPRHCDLRAPPMRHDLLSYFTLSQYMYCTTYNLLLHVQSQFQDRKYLSKKAINVKNWIEYI